MKARRNLTTEQKILAAARKVFQARGMHGARMQEIADAADINKAMLHYYFRNKNQLFQAVLKEAMQQLFPKFELLTLPGTPFEKRIELFVQGYLDVLIENPFVPGFVLNEVNQNPAAFERLFIPRGAKSHYKKILQQLTIENGNKPAKQIDPRQFIVNLLSLCIFPFAAKPMICLMMGMKEKEFTQFIADRRQLIPATIIQSLKRP